MQLERALVTGASSGIGRAIATELATRGIDLVVVARDEARLKSLADDLSTAHGVDVEVLPADLTLPADRARVEQRVADQPTVDCLVNNAGLGTYGDLAGSTADAEQRQVEVNVTALLRLTTIASQTFQARRHGAILNVSSVAGFQPNPHHATYGATKAFVTSLTEAVHEELAPFGVHVTSLCPGYTHTEFHERADWDAGGTPSFIWSQATDVARAGVDGLLANKGIVVPGAHWKGLAAISQVSPTVVSRKIAGQFAQLGSR